MSLIVPGYDIGIISGVLIVPAFMEKMNITDANRDALSGNIAAVLQVGGLLAGAVQFYLNDYFGRRDTMKLGCIVFLIGAVFQTICWNVNILLAGRFISGLGLFPMVVSISLYNSEMAPKEIRGRIIGIQQLMVACGLATSYWVNYVAALIDFSHNPHLRYQIPLGLQTLPAIILLSGVFFIPQSPRWLCMVGKNSQAEQSLSFIRKVPLEDPSIKREVVSVIEYLNEKTESDWKSVFSRENIKRLSVSVLFLSFQQFGGQNLINYFAPRIFKSIGLTAENSELFATGLIGLVRVAMTLPALYVVDTFGRRPLMLIGTAVMLSSFLYLASYLALNVGVTSVSFFGYIAIGCVYLFMSGYSTSWGVMHYVIPAEIFPQNLRAKSETVGGFFELVFQIVSIKTAPILITALPNGGVFFLYSGFLFCFLIWIFICVPETKGLALEDIDIVFQTWKRWKPLEDIQKELKVEKTADPEKQTK
ncbi:hypothetical protein HDV02_002191 [Globomyces sp. JEL0801]|nr:hypothetical protein HDV02_002191 [Globomyces sp. JEL0801]